MRKSSLILASLALIAAFGSGCANTEMKMGRGISNATEFTRGGDFQKSLEDEQMFGGGFATGFVKGFDRTIARTGVGLYEIVTAPIPPYHPVLTNYISALPGHTDAYIPGHLADSTFDTDSMTGFSGGEIAPYIPGSHFTIFDN